jgi:hypothetical protein
MKRIGHVATYPARTANLPTMLETVAPQLDEVRVVVNQFSKAQIRRLPRFDNVHYVEPPEDLKDTGKFFEPRTAEEYVFLLDDDIAFPADYASTMVAAYERQPTRRVVVGIHGVVYSDLFEGASASRFVSKFDKALEKPILVNQLGTGCAMTRGDLLPPFDYMKTSQRFVDVRFARYCHESSIGMVCVARPNGWVKDLEPEESIFETYTRTRHKEQLDEILSFGGFGRLNPSLALAVERQ